MSPRARELLTKAAEAFEDGRSPFCEDWLQENNVSLEECRNLSLGIANAVGAFTRVSDELQMTLLLIWASRDDPTIDPEVLIDAYRQAVVSRRLKRVKRKGE